VEPKMIYCHGEAREFPVDDFRKKDGKLCVPYIHKAEPDHYWTGEDLELSKINTPLGLTER
jgi:hypothetical protein